MIDIMFHHGEELMVNNDGVKEYVPDNMACLGDNNVDTLDIFFVRNYNKTLGYDKIDECYWLIPGRSLDDGLRKLIDDNVLRKMCQAARMNDGVVDVYYKHGVSKPFVVEGDEGIVVVEDDKVAEVDEATFLKAKTNPPPTTNPTPNTSKSSLKTSPAKPNPIPITKPTIKPNPNPIPRGNPSPKQSLLQH
ncbi:hypothetical protein PIB30_060497 [Stylosanthes scabra]|uniref:PB1-like domain-containing protein n=1 Tax=Stylosanthes scabra TaxID=79078 RepID=A0ABU6WKH1_9FABA|nr:hypothetical protein [Stylosanthes scabra]